MADGEMSDLLTTHTSEVTEDQIDHLGHMNVRYYAENASAGTRAMLDALPGWGRRPFVVHDVYTRHHREQLLGTALVVRSAVLGAEPEGLRLHHELAARDTGVLAATFVHRMSPLDEGGQPAPLSDRLVAAAQDLASPTPRPYATTRTISLEADLLASSPSLDEVRARGLVMRRERLVTADECDGAGRYIPEMAPMLVWGGTPVRRDSGPWLEETPGGELMGWASMETRIQTRRLPVVGEEVQSFGATVAIHDKVTHRVHWCFGLARGELLVGFEIVNMAFDTRSRRPMSIPDVHAQRELAMLQPDLVPRPRAGTTNRRPQD
jgi:acyl-CoA thioesterase FadM